MQVLSQSEKQGIPSKNRHRFMDTMQYKRLSGFKTIYTSMYVPLEMRQMHAFLD